MGAWTRVENPLQAPLQTPSGLGGLGVCTPSLSLGGWGSWGIFVPHLCVSGDLRLVPGWEWPKQPQDLGVGFCRKFCVSTLMPCLGFQVLGMHYIPESVMEKAGFRWEKTGLGVALRQWVKQWEFWCQQEFCSFHRNFPLLCPRKRWS